MVFPYFPMVFYGFPMVFHIFLWFSHGFPIGKTRNPAPLGARFLQDSPFHEHLRDAAAAHRQAAFDLLLGSDPRGSVLGDLGEVLVVEWLRNCLIFMGFSILNWFIIP